jgi:hypothetical protein
MDYKHSLVVEHLIRQAVLMLLLEMELATSQAEIMLSLEVDIIIPQHLVLVQ